MVEMWAVNSQEERSPQGSARPWAQSRVNCSRTPKSQRSSETSLCLRRPALHRRRQRAQQPRPPPACHQRRHGLLRVSGSVGEQLPARPPVAGKQKRAEVWRAVDRSIVLFRRDDAGDVPELQEMCARKGHDIFGGDGYIVKKKAQSSGLVILWYRKFDVKSTPSPRPRNVGYKC